MIIYLANSCVNPSTNQPQMSSELLTKRVWFLGLIFPSTHLVAIYHNLPYTITQTIFNPRQFQQNIYLQF